MALNQLCGHNTLMVRALIHILIINRLTLPFGYAPIIIRTQELFQAIIPNAQAEFHHSIFWQSSPNGIHN